MSTAPLAGCSSPPHHDGVTAQRTYDPVLREIADATATSAKVSWAERSQSSVGATTDGCTWFSGTLTTETDLGKAPGWDQVATSIEAALRKHGFAEVTRSELKGGFTGVESSDGSGARLRLASKGPTTLAITVPVNDTC